MADILDGLSEANLPHRVGYYFETLLKFWFVHSPDYQLVESQRQIIVDNITKGEVDFLLKDQNGQLQHWETAIKFYLYDPENQRNGSSFMGPDPRDNFERKRDRLLGHQLNLSRQYFPDVQLRLAYVKGRIFYPRRGTHPEILPTGLSEDHLQGVWFRCKETESYLEGLPAESGCQILSKPFWLSSVGPEPAPTYSADQFLPIIRRHFNGSLKPVHFCQVAINGNETKIVERGFVVHDSWPFIESEKSAKVLSVEPT